LVGWLMEQVTQDVSSIESLFDSDASLTGVV
jgi:hypothetical protein